MKLTVFATSLMVAAGAVAGEPAKTHKANYDLAARWTTQKVAKLIFDTSVTPHWLSTGDRFWYSFQTSAGRSFYIVDPARKQKAPVFDNAAMAALLTRVTRTPFDAQHLPMRTLKFVKNDAAVQFSVDLPRDAEVEGEKKTTEQTTTDQDRSNDEPQQEQAAPDQGAQGRNKTLWFEYELGTRKLTVLENAPPRKPAWASISPDEKTVVFARGQNLYMMDAENYARALKKADDPAIVETQITKDGEEHYGYARRLTDQDRRDMQRDLRQKNARVPPVMIFWSRDSKRFSLTRQDQRKVADLWVINSLANPRPTLETYRYGMPGEVNVAQSEIEVFDRDTKDRLKVKGDKFKDQTVSIASARTTAVNRERERAEPQWVADTSDKLYFTRTSRDMRKVDVCLADATTGEVKVLIEERQNIYIETKPLRLIDNGQELIHWSERDGWGHYYLYDGIGTLKNQITTGEFVAESIEGIDEKARVMYFQAEGREPGEDPYFTHTYRVNLDGGGLKLVDAGIASHAASASDSVRYFVDNYSTVDAAPRAVLRDVAGNQVMELETTDLGALREAGYKFPEQFKVKADDGVTDLYGVMYKPFDFDPNKKYPVIAFVYPGPQTESVTKTFSPRSANVSLAQFGFIVIEVGNRGGNPKRSKWYHTFGYGNLRDYGLADKKAAIEQLSRRHSYIDADRVGIYGHSGGGFMSTAAMLVYPDFFKVAVSSSGNHENNIYNRAWSEKHHGVKEVADKDGNVKFEYSIEKNSDLAKNLKGRLLLVTGDIDDNVHPANTLRMADSLIKANKRFDMLVLPGQRHGYGDESEYFSWIRADYFCRHLLGDAADSVDLVEMNREREQKGARPGQQQQQQQQNTQGGRRRGAEN